MTNNTRFNVGYAIAAVLAVFFIQYIISSANQVAAIPYSDFQRMLRDGKVATVGISDRFLQGTLKEPLPGGQKQFVTTRVDPEFAGELEKYGVRFTGQIESTFLRDLLSWIMPVLLFFGVWWYIGKRFGTGVGGGLMAIGKSKAKIYVEADTGVTFADVAGVDEAKDEVREIVDFLKGPAEYGRLGGRLPKGVLLVGPPGTGKTLLAKAIAGEAKVPFFSISGSEFVEMFVGVGAARVRDLFQQAHEKAPAIIFIDELDALGRARAIGPFAGGHDEKEQTLNQLLVELDGFDSRTGLVILAATNRPEILDPALLRAGRFDRQVLVDRPDKKGRVQILQVHMKKVLLASDVDVETIAALTPGFTGADLANLVNEAALLATRRGAQAVTTKDFSDAVERMVAGLEKRNRLLNPKEREIVAYHEMGHALIALALPGVDPVHKVSIIPRGISKMAVLLGGRAAELIVFGHLSTGAADDLRRVTDIARSMVTRYGMSEKLGNVAYDSDSNNFLAPSERALPWRERQYAEQTAATVDHEVRAITDAVFKRAQGILQARRAILDRAARTLLEKETLERGDLDQFLREGSQGTTQVA
ncbi:MAG TPA: ATP-dependent zinc metalloprotease FtsH [Bradyrhizobium sp.]|nr:ATP-dependent zinc metalloprotease FtsH [Bradyrhizobium sp.]